ncbi:PDR/VanB family oxidoreductase [Dactylosporangium sp. CA-092794]|uniref:PDR/VanB family oxidoreductase n=1 Tax=Dactylosporangium sp. CA-092794 TaxID=3239929 RepID=UPI003D93CA6B
MTPLTFAAPQAAPAPDRPGDLALRVTAVRLEADDVISLVLASPAGADLPGWAPGAHIELLLPSGRMRQYSLCGPTENRKEYRIAVLRERAGRGGSAEIHDSPLVGRVFPVRGPRNHFELRPSRRYRFIAGGIGVTPVLAMARSLGRDVPWTLHYGGRSRASMAFVDELRAAGGERVIVTAQDEQGILDVDAIVAGADADTAIYCCGPAGLLAAVAASRESLAPRSPLYVERFTGSGGSAAAGTATSAGEREFEIELRRSGVTAVVPPGRTVLDVIREFVPDAPFSCAEGYCGSCETAVLAGTPDHRDEILTEAERARNRTMFPCVSRARSDRLVLDL